MALDKDVTPDHVIGTLSLPQPKRDAIEHLKAKILQAAVVDQYVYINGKTRKFKASHAKDAIVDIGRRYKLTKEERGELYTLVTQNMVNHDRYTPAAIQERIDQEEGGITRMGGVHSAVNTMLRLGKGNKSDARYLYGFAKSHFATCGEGPTRAERRQARKEEALQAKEQESQPDTATLYVLVTPAVGVPYTANYRGVKLLIYSGTSDALACNLEINELLDRLTGKDAELAVDYVALLGEYAVVYFKPETNGYPPNMRVYVLDEVQTVSTSAEDGVE